MGNILTKRNIIIFVFFIHYILAIFYFLMPVETTYLFFTFGLSIFAFTISILTIIEIKAFKLSTHQVQYVPIDHEESQKFWKEEEKRIEKEKIKYDDLN